MTIECSSLGDYAQAQTFITQRYTYKSPLSATTRGIIIELLTSLYVNFANIYWIL
jgi:hypothetical protein